MKMRCWICAVLGLFLLHGYVRSAEKPALPLVKKGTVVKVTETEVVVKSEDEKQGEVSYPRKEVSQHLQLSGEAEKDFVAELRTRAKYSAKLHMTLGELTPGSEVKIEWGSSKITDSEKVVEDGNYYQIKVNKLAKKE